MKKVLFLLLAVVATVVVSCSKDAKINRRIDGEWKVVSLGGEVIQPADGSIAFSFNKDKRKDGDGIVTFSDTYNGVTETESTPFTYSIEDEKITLVLDGYAEVLTVDKYEKKKLEFIDSDGSVWVLDPK